MDPKSFDALTRSLATPKSRRRFLATATALAATALTGLRGAAQTGCPPGQSPNRKGDCSCPSGTNPCPDGCFDRNGDVNNCGSCGNVCPAGAECRKGECRCPSGTVACSGICRTQASFADDPSNCGGCGVVCPLGAPGTCQGASICTAGVCGFLPAREGMGCRPASDLCDAPEYCDGISLDCPADGVLPLGTECRAGTGLCEAAATCDGLSKACPANGLKGAGVQCRDPQGNCDEPEFCTGSSADCPADAFSSAATKCVSKTGPCTQDVFCTGTSPTCPPGGQVPEGQQGTCPEGFACNSGSCRQTCDVPADCFHDECDLPVCIGGFCGTTPQVDGGQCGPGRICRSGQCVGNGVCDDTGTPGICPFSQPAGCNNFCGCLLTAENAPICFQRTEFDCQGLQPCESSPDCPSGWFCGSESCSGCPTTKVCFPLCQRIS